MATQEPSWSELGKPMRSLGSGDSTYYGVQIRRNGKNIRIQGLIEVDAPITPALGEWLDGLFKPFKSTAGTKTLYAPAQARRESKLGWVRLQVSGPPFNRTWGACFSVLAPNLTAYLKASTATGPTPEKPMSKPLLDSPLPPVIDKSVFDMFEVGDTVEIIKRGDGDGCSGGPLIGAIMVVKAYQPEYDKSGECGPWRLESPAYPLGWYTTAEHFKLLHKKKVQSEPDYGGEG